uniref:Myb/SANT-like domain-containing protein n=1 Tax=Triticum urartu TaxID=4572 RepID=A0A8R7QVK2_TRIUA
MNDSSWKVDTGHKSGYLTYIEKKMAEVLPHADLKADPHIRSKVKILKKQLSYVLEIMQNGSGFGWDDEKKMVIGDRETYMGWAKSREGAGPLYMKPMVNFDKLCEVYASDLAKGGSAKGPGEEEVVEVEETAGAEPTSQPAKENSPQAHENTNPSGGSRPGRKRTYPDDDALESGLISVSNTIAKFLEAEQDNAKTMNGLQRAFMHEAEVHEQASANRTKLLDILQNLKDLSKEEVVMAVRVIGGDAGKTELFIKLRDDFKVLFVRQELEAAKK